MDAIGIVEAIEKDKIKVKIPRESACGGNCAECRVCTVKDTEITVENTIGAIVGDRVRLIADDSVFVKRAAIGYLVLTALLILGGVVGSKIGGEWMSFLCALSAVLLGLVVFRKCFKRDIDITVVKE